MFNFRSFRHLSLGAATQAFVGYGLIAWMPPFLMRAHGMSSGEVGTALGLIIGIGGGAGTILGGLICDRLASRDVRWYMWLPAGAFLAALPFVVASLMTPNLGWSLAIFLLPCFLINLYTGPTFAIVQTLAPPDMRAAASALLLFIINIIGLVLGPTMVGFLSDLLQVGLQLTDIDSLRYAMCICALVYAVSFVNYLFAARSLAGDLETGNDYPAGMAGTLR